MEDNLQAPKVLTPLADEALSASAKDIPYVCVSICLCARRVCVCVVAALCYSGSTVALVMTPRSFPCAWLL